MGRADAAFGGRRRRAPRAGFSEICRLLISGGADVDHAVPRFKCARARANGAAPAVCGDR